MQQQLESKYATREKAELKIVFRFPDSSKAECSFYREESTQVMRLCCMQLLANCSKIILHVEDVI